MLLRELLLFPLLSGSLATFSSTVTNSPCFPVVPSCSRSFIYFFYYNTPDPKNNLVLKVEVGKGLADHRKILPNSSRGRSRIPCNQYLRNLDGPTDEHSSIQHRTGNQFWNSSNREIFHWYIRISGRSFKCLEYRDVKHVVDAGLHWKNKTICYSPYLFKNFERTKVFMPQFLVTTQSNRVLTIQLQLNKH